MPGFVNDHQTLLLLDRMAQRYSTRPSSILHIEDQLAAYQIDLCVMHVGVEEDRRISEEQRRRAKHGGDRNLSSLRSEDIPKTEDGFASIWDAVGAKVVRKPAAPAPAGG